MNLTSVIIPTFQDKVKEGRKEEMRIFPKAYERDF